MKAHLLVSLLVVFALLGACAPKTIIRSDSGTPPASTLPGNKAQNPQQALTKYTKQIPAAKQADAARTEAWKQSVGSAVTLGEYDLAEKNLQAWKNENTNATASWDWNQANARLLLARKGKDAYAGYLVDMVGRTDLDWNTREAAGMELVDHFWAIPEYGLAFEALGVVYKAAPDAPSKSGLEATALSKADSLTVKELNAVLDHASLGTDPNAYPWSLVTWSRGTKLLAEDKANWQTVGPVLATIVSTGKLQNKDFFANSLRALEQQMNAGAPAPAAQNVALLLPLSGPYAQVGWKIAKGADTAWREGRAQSAAPQIKMINTESPTFLDELRALGGTPIIGGPLRKDIWEKIRLAGLTKSARFLTFLPSVENEGREAWRFFSSPADQVRAVIRGSRELGVSSFAVLYPQDRFGTAMKDVFMEQATALGVSVPVVRGYDLENPQGWTKAVAAILGHTGDKNTLSADPPFQAVFLPDSLFRVQQLAPMFHYYEETRLLLLGPQLWTQSLAETPLEMQYYDLTMFPGTWDQDQNSTVAAGLKDGLTQSNEQPDLWSALGYDFVRFCGYLGGPQDSPEAFNQALIQAESRMTWSMAPLHWSQGMATQDLILFQPTGTSMVHADLDKIRQARDARQTRRDARRTELQPKRN